ncbi:type IX secretion system sortase PorU [Emticicia aquatilis]|nr:type IX secretion system sortase PorU [Emticicia aquatilis]
MIMLFLSFAYSLLFSLFSHAQSSVLATGEWYKIATTRTGVHKIDASFLRDAGIDIAKLNPQNIRIFGNGGGVLPQANNALRAKDLTENFIEVVGENDGKFDASDYILFYSESSHRILYSTNNQLFTHQNNPYSDTSFVFLNISDTKGLRIKNQTLVGSANSILTFDDFTFHEIDQKNVVSLGGRDLGGSGREWYGESFGVSPDISFDLKTEGIIPNSSIKLTSAILGASFTTTKVILKLNADSLIGEQSLRAIGTGTYDIKGNENIQTFTAISNGKSTQKLTFSFNKNNQNSSVAYLNYFEVQTKRKLQFYELQTLVRSIESLGNKTSNFIISQASNTHKIWDVTNPLLPENIPFQINNSEASFGAETQNKLKTFVLFSSTNLLEPNSIQKVSNQNIQQTQTPDLLILTIKNWHEQAERLAAFRRTNDGLSVAVVDIEQVYNEFSSGSPDPTAIRDFGRFLWQKNPTKLKYLLLLADASFDYKNIIQYASIDTKLQIPTYESRESLNPVNSYASDDYFGFFEDNEGEWQENNAGNHSMEIGVGRLPVKSIEEAKNVVDKLIYYARTQRTAGSWRRKISFVADDGDFNIHQQDADDISEVTLKTTKDLIINKIYLDAFPQIATANGAISPEVNKALNKSVNEGALIINYSGHGGTDGWTEEKVLTRDQIQSWRNLNNMPLFLTATCSFGRFDDPGNVSGAEMAMLSPRGAAIGLLTTTRPVYSNTNFLLNNAFYQAFAQKNTNPNLRLGDIFRITKNNSLSGVFNRNFSLLGDPSMQLAYPTDKIVLSKINGTSPEKQTIKALSKVSLEGEIINSADGLRKNNFNGKILVSVFDKPSEVSTLGQKTEKFKYKTYRNQVFEGLAEVKNGVFKVNFVVPKDINYQVGAGRVNFYAISTDSTLDASGSYNELMIGGSETNILSDSKAPEIKLSIDKDNLFEAQISDENGINISQAGVGHEMILVLNDTLQITANQYFTSTDDYTKGILKYSFGKLPAGQYTVKLKVWDTYNNSAEEALKFIVETEKLKILRAYNYPNPVESSTNFYIEHNAENQDLTFTLSVFNSAGKQVFEKTETCYLCDKTLNLGMKIEPKNWTIGTYFYRISVDSVSENSTSSFSGKMVFWK